MSHSPHMHNSRRRQQLKYIVADAFSAICVWLLFLLFRWMVYEGRLFGVDSLLIPAFNFYQPLVLYPIGCLTIYYLSGYYLRPYNKRLLPDLWNTLVCSLFISLAAFFCIIIDDQVENYRLYYVSLIVLFGLQSGISYLFRAGITLTTRWSFRNGYSTFNTMIIGSPTVSENIRQELSTDNVVLTMPASELTDFATLQKRYNIDRVIIAAEDTTCDRELYELINQIYPQHVDISFTPRVYDLLTGAVRINNLKGSPLVTITEQPMSDWQLSVKRATDIAVSLLCLIVLSPLYLILTLLVRTDSKGPAIYKQERIGLHGRPFHILKFRTMYVDSESETPMLTAQDDTRITPIGHVLRKYRLDELPQFWNVLKGDMSLVGPRPERAYYIRQIVRKAPYYCLLYKIRPGLTSWGPIKIGYADSIEKMVKRLNYDIAYMENMSLLLDMKILFYTIKVIVDGKGQ